jgi:hypothetical protein
MGASRVIHVVYTHLTYIYLDIKIVTGFPIKEKRPRKYVKNEKK